MAQGGGGRVQHGAEPIPCAVTQQPACLPESFASLESNCSFLSLSLLDRTLQGQVTDMRDTH